MKKLLKKIFILVFILSIVVSIEAEEIKFGVILPLSGDLVSYGKTTLDGIKLCVDEINKSGGINGKKIKLIVEDNKGIPVDSKKAYIHLASSQKVSAIIGPITSTNSKNVRRTAKALKVPMISPTATNDRITLKNPYVFRACFNDSFQGRIIANYASNNLKFKTAALMVDMNSDYSKGLAKSFKKYFKELGGKIVKEEGYQQKDTEFGVQLKNIKKSNAEALFVPGYPPELPLIIKQAKVIGYKGKLCGADGWDNADVINGSGDNITGSFIVGAFSKEEKRDIVKKFIKNFKEKYNREPGTFEALGYDSVLLIAEAAKNGTTPESIKNNLFKIKDFNAVTGKITINKDGDAEKSAIVLEIDKNGDKYETKYKTTVNP
jgi:branched-chain amino acid transport system substrate-binding protein